MHASSALMALTGLVAAGVALAQSSLTVATPPSFVQCQPISLSWSGGTAPYFPRITTPGASGTTVVQFDQTSGTSQTWTVNQAVGSQFTIAVTDSTGVTQYSSTTNPVVAGSSSACLSSSSGAAGATSTSAAASSSSSAAATSAASSSASRSSASSGSSTASRSSSAAPSASTSSRPDSAASLRGYSAVVGGMVAVVAAALA